MSRNQLIRFRVRHILETTEYLRILLHDMTFEQFAADRTIVLASLHSLQIAGEAAGALPERFREEHPELPWREMRDMRNVIAHRYFEIDLEVVWDTIHSDLLPLESDFRRLLDSLPEGT